MAEFIGTQAGYDNPAAKDGKGLRTGPTPEFKGVQPGAPAASVIGWLRKRTADKNV